MRRSMAPVATVLAIVALTLPPILYDHGRHVPSDFLTTAIKADENLIVAVSLVLLIGLVGQISLCQAAFVGVGAFVSGIFINHFALPFPFSLVVGLMAGAAGACLIGVVALRVRGLYLAVATLIFAFVCHEYLFTRPWFVPSSTGIVIEPQTIGQMGTLPYFDLSQPSSFYYVALAVAAASLYAVVNLRDSRIGRAFAAIRGSEVAAASLGINVTRFKLLAFACSGALAGLAGALLLVGSSTVAPDQFDYQPSLNYLAIAVVGGLTSLGGAMASAVLFAVLDDVFFRYPALANYLDVISAGLLIAVLLFFRGGLGAVPERIALLRHRAAPFAARAGAWLRSRLWKQGDVETVGEPRPGRVVPLFAAVNHRVHGVRRAVRAVRRRLPGPLRARGAAAADVVSQGAPAVDVVSLVARLEHRDRQPPAEVRALPIKGTGGGPPAGRGEQELRDLVRAAADAGQVAGQPGHGGRRKPVLIAASGITVRFGGLTAVSDASLQVGAGEIVGLIGPNGAGKTTLFNSLLGLNQPASGRVFLFDNDVTEWDVHERAALGVGRTFQILQLFRDLTVFDNLLVATHLQNGTGLFGSLFVTRRAMRQEREARQRVRAVLRLMDLEHLADRRVQGLPFGVLRLIEIARTLVTGARLVCFDEPASGLDSHETERVIEWFQFLRQIGITVLVIEHDVDMVVRLCDHIYVLDQGRMIASGPPAQIQRDPAVMASYLGTAFEEAV